MLNRIVCLTFIAACLCACDPSKSIKATAAEIEAVGMHAIQTQQVSEIEKLRTWASSGSAIAQRELALTYFASGHQNSEALTLLNQAALGGDGQAAYYLGEVCYKAKFNQAKDLKRAYDWYLIAANKGQDKASLMLARMTKYGEGTQQDLEQSAQWLLTASEQGNGQAMFLLSNALESGEGIPQDLSSAKLWLERAAQNDFPPAIQALALQQTSSETGKETAQHLMKEARDERALQWNKYQ